MYGGEVNLILVDKKKITISIILVSLSQNVSVLTQKMYYRLVHKMANTTLGV